MIPPGNKNNVYYPKKVEAKDFKYKERRNSHTVLNEVYFWTITVNRGRHLLKLMRINNHN